MSILLAPHLVHLKAAGYAKRTITDRELVVNIADRELPHGVDTPTTEELALWFAHDNWKTWTRITYYRHLNGLYRWASEGHAPRLEWNPLTDLKCAKAPKGMPDPVTDDELYYALEHSSPRWQAIICCAAYAGLRAGEIGRLRREHCTREKITVWHGKGDRTDVLPMHPEIWARIEDKPAGLLFPNAKGAATVLPPLARGHFNRIRLPDVHLHRFRHWYATMLLDGGATISVVQSLMRHASMETTARYLLIRDEQRRFAVSTLPVPSSNPLQEAA